MDAGWIIAACAVFSALGGAIGSWAMIRVQLAVQDRRLQTVEQEIVSLRHDRHEHAEWIHGHEIRLDHLERK